MYCFTGKRKISVENTRGNFNVRRTVYLLKTAKVNKYILYIFGKIELLSIYATKNYFILFYFKEFQEAKNHILVYNISPFEKSVEH